ncbi:MAG: CoA transferase, partial [Chloroflexi bacterium]|nr:CoA transferase [Chloroflexota bacterium]
DVPALAHAVGLEAIAGLSSAELEQAVESRLPNASVTYWVEHLNAAGIGAHRVISDLQELMTDSWVINHGLSVTREHDGLGRITTPGPAPRLSRTPVRVGRPAPRPGANAREIINEIGLGDRFDDLVENGVIRLDGVVAG